MLLSREPVAKQFDDNTYKQLIPRVCIVITDFTKFILDGWFNGIASI